jgi:hypothetical protein
MARALFPCVREALALSVAPDGDDQSAGSSQPRVRTASCWVAWPCRAKRLPPAIPRRPATGQRAQEVSAGAPLRCGRFVYPRANSQCPNACFVFYPDGGGGACKRKVPGARSSAERSVVTNSFADFRCAFVVLGPSSKCHRTPRSLSYHHYQVAFCTEAPGLVSPRLQSHNVFQSKAGGAAHLPPSKAEPSGELGATFGGPSGGDNLSFCLTRARTCAFCAGGLP